MVNICEIGIGILQLHEQRPSPFDVVFASRTEKKYFLIEQKIINDDHKARHCPFRRRFNRKNCNSV